MTTPIKIVYSWIGPMGPIPNTELPTVLNFADVAEGSRTTSHRFWADDIWNKIFCNNPSFELAPAAYLDSDAVFVFPMTLAWRIPVLSYFYQDSGLLEFSHAPNHIIHQIRSRNGFLLIDQSAETFIRPNELIAITNYFNLNGIPLNKIIYLTGCMNAEYVYSVWRKEQGINEILPKINFMPFPVSYDGTSIIINQPDYAAPDYDVTLVPEKLFLCWNRRYRAHRTTLAVALDKLGLIDRSYYSMARNHPEHLNIPFETVVDLNHPALQTLGANNIDVERFVIKLPLVLDDEHDIQRMCADWDNSTRSYYQNSLISLVTETNFSDNEMSLTEKSAKPFKEMHPFIILGVSGILKVMHDLGFKTFNEFWSEDYDNIVDSNQRMMEIIRICNDIGNWDREKILDFRRRVKPILEHNYENLKKRAALQVADKVEKIIKGSV